MNKKIPRIILTLTCLLLILATQACSPSTAYPNPGYSNPAVHPTITALPIPDSSDAVVRVSLADAKAAFDAHTAVILDVRDAGSYSDAHIPGALNIPLDQLEARLGELDPNAWIITYCT